MKIIEKIQGNINEIQNIENYHIETVILKPEALKKAIQRVKSDHGNEYGIRIDRNDLPLHDGDILLNDGHNIVMIHTMAEEMIVITPEDIDQMGRIAHLLGNTHKPVKIKDGQIILERDPVVEKILVHNHIKYQIKEMTLNEPLSYADLSYE
ncbi:MAG TPA: urease accessory protein UreE [Candidatus Ligilactobacillus excrementigallinarum]|uniref:Urease accessory protein UreE n=1 Tax=Candidatus Ligilactobacillus excrementigallinarum TaxID=2838641 RepID=A0A9D1UVR7_9LACO|nr:urease accessory protein UreE [Candidatus Ligilactobacillus excrementigallinarum]